MLEAARQMRVTSHAGTELTHKTRGRSRRRRVGLHHEAGQRRRTGPAACAWHFQRPAASNGQLVLAPGDVNLTFKRYLRDAIALTIVDDYVTSIEGEGADADMMRGYLAAWGDREAYGVSHVGWGMNPLARWDAMAFYDRRDFNGTELRAFAGNFLYSTGANEVAGRHTLGHFDLPLRNCTIALDEKTIIEKGELLGELR